MLSAAQKLRFLLFPHTSSMADALRLVLVTLTCKINQSIKTQDALIVRL